MTKKNNQKTKDQIIELLKLEGPQEAGPISQALNITAMAVRQHLYEMVDLDLITHSLVPRKKGRPAKLWQLTQKAHNQFPNRHADLLIDLLQSTEEAFGQEGVETLLNKRFEKQKEHYKDVSDPQLTLAEKVSKLTTLRNQEGYMAESHYDEQQDNYRFIENHCPICDAAKACNNICQKELNLFNEVIGDEYNVERTEHIINGEHRCCYDITKKCSKAS